MLTKKQKKSVILNHKKRIPINTKRNLILVVVMVFGVWFCHLLTNIVICHRSLMRCTNLEHSKSINPVKTFHLFHFNLFNIRKCLDSCSSAEKGGDNWDSNHATNTWISSTHNHFCSLDNINPHFLNPHPVDVKSSTLNI